MPNNTPCPLKPMKIVEQGDILMGQAQGLYDKYEDIMEPSYRTVAEDRMVIAEDFRQGVEEKSWLAKRTQAKRYLTQAQEALETVKKSVDEVIEV